MVQTRLLRLFMKETSQISSRRSGFTLVEMLVVMAIIAILMSLVLGIFGAAGQGALESKAKAEIADLMNEIEKYNADEGSYPADWAAFNTWYTARYPGTAYTISDGDPSDPIDPWGSSYVYTYNSSVPFVYFIGSLGPNLTNDNGDVDDITNRNGALQ